MIANTEGFSKLSDPKYLNKAVNYVPLQRYGNTFDIGEATLFLVSPAASYITGITLFVDGGQLLSFPNFTMFSDDYVEMWKKPKF